jgi:small-conductance mechanosensitive channel
MNDKSLRLGLGILRSVIIVLGAVLLVMIASRSVTDETYNDGMAAYGSLLDNVYTLTLVALVICTAAAVLFGLYFFVTNIKKRLATLGGVVGFVLIGLVSFYALADKTVLRAYESSGIEVTEQESQFAGGGMYMVYLLGAIAIIAIIWTEVSRLFK